MTNSYLQKGAQYEYAMPIALTVHSVTVYCLLEIREPFPKSQVLHTDDTEMVLSTSNYSPYSGLRVTGGFFMPLLVQLPALS
ncbi:hypothetical protein KDL29_14825 [bacterium]|nr:hypothetical protein [bacterium]